MNKLHLPLLAAEGFTSFSDALSDLWSEIWKVVVPIGIILLIAYGVAVAATWISAGGDEAKKKSAKTKIIYYTTGIIFIFVILVGVPMIVAGMSDWAGNYT